MESRDPISAAFIYGLGAAVAIVWIASVFADIVSTGYATPIALHGLMGTVVGSVFADGGLRKARAKIHRLSNGGDDPPNGGRGPGAGDGPSGAR